MPRTKDRPSSFARSHQWCSRHHVTSSKANDGLPKASRDYFDNLSQVHVKFGELTDVLAYTPKQSDYNAEHEMRLRRRFIQFPQYFSPRNKLFPIWAGGTKGMCSPKQHSIATGSAPFTSLRSATPSSRDAALLEFDRVPHKPPGPSKYFLNEDVKTAPALCSLPSDGVYNHPESHDSGTGSARLDRSYTKAKSHEGLDSKRAQAKPRHRDKSLIEAERSMNKSGLADEHLLELCIKRHMHLIGLWRRLNTDGSMSLHKAEFVKGLKRMDYDGHDVDKIWNRLDRDGTGTISFLEFAPEHALELARFKHWAEMTFGSIKNMFLAMDKDHNGKLTYPEFRGYCNDHEMPVALRNSLATLFLLVDDPDDKSGKDVITLAELTFLADWKCPVYLWQEADHTARQQFQERLVREHCGNPLIAWRKCLDIDGNMKVGYDEFVIACKRLCRAGVAEAQPEKGVAAMFCALDHDRSGWFTLRDWDRTCYRLLFNFVIWAKTNFGKVSAWARSCGHHESGITLTAFKKSTKPISMSEEEEELLFEGLSLTPITNDHKGKIRTCNIIHLDRWDPQSELQDDIKWENLAVSQGL